MIKFTIKVLAAAFIISMAISGCRKNELVSNVLEDVSTAATQAISDSMNEALEKILAEWKERDKAVEE